MYDWYYGKVGRLAGGSSEQDSPEEKEERPSDQYEPFSRSQLSSSYGPKRLVSGQTDFRKSILSTSASFSARPSTA